mmetsp:Transcript_55322/g.99628  ORF Transcript_55322/g.99628 Transcript_55322/m.99628 type:complete len:453 (-) Transcript_55322:355-1713(-)
MLDHQVLLDELGVLRVERRVHVGVGSSLQFLHELEDGILLVLEKPLDPLADVGDAPLEWEVRLVAQQLHHDVAPGERAHGHAARLDHIALLDLYCDFREPQEDLNLVHQAPELRPAVHLHVEGGDLDFISEVVDVVIQTTEVLRGQHAEVRGAQGLVVAVEAPELFLEVHHRIQVEDALHHMRQRRGEGESAVARGADNPVWIGVVELVLQILHLPGGRRLEVPEVRQDRADGLREHDLDPLLHEEGEALEADGLHVAPAQTLGLHLPEVLSVHVLLHLIEGLRGGTSVPPPGQRDGKPDQCVRQVPIPIHPLAAILVRQVTVVLVELVPDQDRSLELGVDLAALRQGGHRGCIVGLLDAQHHVPLVAHEAVHEVRDLVREGLLGIIGGEVAEAGQVHDLHVHAATRLHADVDRIRRDRLPALLVRIAHQLHHGPHGVLAPVVRLLVADVPP